MNRNQNWYDLNAGRSYPLDDAATRTGDAGERLPNDVLADLSVRFPASLGARAYLSSVAVTDTLVTFTLLACPAVDAAGDFVPLAALTARRPLADGRHLALDPLYPGVGGWAVLGPAETRFRGRFSTPAQGLVLARCARPYRSLPVASARKAGLATGLTGLVRLVGGPDVEVVGADRVVDGRARRVVVVRLKASTGARNVFDLYRGPCGARPETGNCDRPGVEYLNTVGPDCAGNIQLVFGGGVVPTPYAGSSEGLVLDYPLGMTDVCTRRDRLPDAAGRLPNEYDDLCTSEYEGQYPGDDDAAGETLPALGVPYTSSQILEPGTLPYREVFDDQDAEGWRVLVGTFGFAATDSPDQPGLPPGPMVTYRRGYTVTRWVPRPAFLTACGYNDCPDGAPAQFTILLSGGTGDFAGADGTLTVTFNPDTSGWTGSVGDWTASAAVVESLGTKQVAVELVGPSGPVSQFLGYIGSAPTCCGPFTLALDDSIGTGTPSTAGPMTAVYCGPCGPSASLSSSAVYDTSSSEALSSAVRPTGHAYEARSETGRNVAVWDAGAPATALNVRARTDVQLLIGGARVNGGLVLNYHTVSAPTPHDEYYAADLDLATDSLRLRRWTGASFAPVAEAAGLGLVTGDWYRLTATVTPADDPAQTVVRAEVVGVTNPAVTASLTATVNRYLPADGRFGVATEQAYARFSYFELTEA